MIKLYIISTPYHLLITLTKTLLAKRIGKDIIIIYNFHIPPTIIKNTGKIFSKVYTCGRFNILTELPLLFFKINRIPILSKIKSSKYREDFFRNKEIFIFNDNSYFGCMFNHLGIEYNLIEDGLNLYQNEFILHKYCHKIYKIIGISWDCFGRSKYAKSIEVNDSKNLYISHTKIIESNRNEIFKKLNEKDVDIICDIFGYTPLSSTPKGESSLLLTQPLSEDGEVSHSKKIEIYKYLVKKYAVGTLYIKAHPRENEDYKKVFPNAIILGNNKLPFEIFLLKEKLHFARAISTYTSVMDAISCADEKISMGIEWVKAFQTTSFNRKDHE